MCVRIRPERKKFAFICNLHTAGAFPRWQPCEPQAAALRKPPARRAQSVAAAYVILRPRPVRPPYAFQVRAHAPQEQTVAVQAVPTDPAIRPCRNRARTVASAFRPASRVQTTASAARSPVSAASASCRPAKPALGSTSYVAVRAAQASAVRVYCVTSRPRSYTPRPRASVRRGEVAAVGAQGLLVRSY
jgi:hypothetical protein